LGRLCLRGRRYRGLHVRRIGDASAIDLLNVAMVYLFAVVIIAVRFPRGPAIMLAMALIVSRLVESFRCQAAATVSL
jgi:hypothetical protein